MNPVAAGDELATIFPAPRSIMLAGRLLEVRPFGLAHVQQFATFIQPAFADFRSYLASLDAASPDCISLVCAACDKADPEYVQSLSAIDRFILFNHILEVNEGVFTPALDREIDRCHRALNGLIGPTSSQDSPAQVSTPQGLRRKGQARSSLHSKRSTTSAAPLQ